MENTDTRQKILDTALDMFAKKGYSAVSIRDICGKVGIKESTVYYHLENKKAIFDALQARFEETAQGMMKQLENALAKMPESGTLSSDKISDVFFEEYLMDPFCNRFLRILFIEQFNDKTLQVLFDKWLFREPMQFQSKIFAQLMKMRLLPDNDADYLIVRYYAPIFMFSVQYLLSGEMTPARKKKFREKTDKHIKQLFAEIFKAGRL